MEEGMMMISELSGRIGEGQYVLVQRGDQQRIVQMKAQQTISFGKGQSQQDIQLKNALGQEFYSAFRAVPLTDEELKSLAESKEASNSSNNKNAGKNNNKKNQQQQQHQKKNKLFSLEKCSEPAAKSFSQLFETPTSVSSGKDNRNIFDDKKDCSQPLRHSDIASLKDQGLTSKEIVETIVTSSKSFAQKTEFSQEKYLKKKENKYGDVLQFIPIDLHLIADFYFSRDPSKVLGLRADTISQILSYGNIHANGRYLLYENAGGILVAAVLQRLGGFGLLLHCHAGTNPQQQAVAYMNFSKEYLKPMRNLDVFYLIQGRGTKNGKEGTEEVVTSTKNTNEVEDVEEQPAAKKSRIEEDGGVDMDVGEEVSVAALDEKDDKVGGAGGKPKNNREENEKSLELIETATFDGLIIAGKEHPLTIFQKLLPRLNLSSPFVVYCSYPEPLMECYLWIKEKGLGVNMHIVDNWLRNIQVETDRTHPEINMSSSGGYILYGIYVNSN